MELAPTTLKEANAFIDAHHRHHRAVVGWRCGVAVVEAGEVVGCAILGRPVARGADDGRTAEITRLCVIDTAPRNAVSMLYGAMCRAAKALGYKRVITYTLESEPGTSLRASGFVSAGLTAGGSWSRPSRPRIDMAPTCRKQRWERSLS